MATGTPIYTRMMRWGQAGVLDRVFEQLQRQRLMRVRIESVCLNSTIMRAHPGQAGDAPEGRRLIQEMGPA